MFRSPRKIPTTLILVNWVITLEALILLVAEDRIELSTQ